MGLQAYREILRKSRLSQGPEANDMVAGVGARIAAATGRTDYAWEFRVIDDNRQINAFALPGGKVAVYTGLLAVARDEAGLAAVLGHEISHVIARHGGERISRELLVQTGLTATMAKAGYDPRAALELWRRMAEASRGRGEPPEFLSTHPSHGTRNGQIEHWMPEALQHYHASPHRS